MARDDITRLRRWALLDLVTIVVLGSGLYLWLSRRRSPIEVRLTEEATVQEQST